MSPIGTSNTANQPSTAAAPSPTSTVDKNMFLQLLVAQLKNQDPTNPTDSTTFVTQLAQFQQLESSENSAQDLSAIRQDADTFIAANSSASATAANKSAA